MHTHTFTKWQSQSEEGDGTDYLFNKRTEEGIKLFCTFPHAHAAISPGGDEDGADDVPADPPHLRVVAVKQGRLTDLKPAPGCAAARGVFPACKLWTKRKSHITGSRHAKG